MRWRDMTEPEATTLPEARLGGALLGAVAAAALLFVIAAAGALIAFDQLRAVGLRYMIAVGFVALWSATFVVMTLLRLRTTPTIANLGLAVWIGWRLAAFLLSHAGWPLAVDLLGEIVLVAGFCGYMTAGVRPNAYYRRRLPAA
jgi:hypothetical protein